MKNQNQFVKIKRDGRCDASEVELNKLSAYQPTQDKWFMIA